jgi:hypothetical protein
MVRLQARLSADVETLKTSHAIGRATMPVMAVACGVAAATVYSNQPMLRIMEAAFPGQAWITDLVPMATQLGFAVGLLLMVPLGDRVDRRSLDLASTDGVCLVRLRPLSKFGSTAANGTKAVGMLFPSSRSGLPSCRSEFAGRHVVWFCPKRGKFLPSVLDLVPFPLVP